MTEPSTDSVPQAPEAPAKKKGMPPAAIRTIAYSCHFCAMMSFFLAFYAWRMSFPLVFAIINVLVGICLIAGANWMLVQLRRLRDGHLESPNSR